MSTEPIHRSDPIASRRRRSATWAPVVPAGSIAIAALSMVACSRDWDAYDPRLGTGGQGSTSSSAPATSGSGGSGGTAPNTGGGDGGLTCEPNSVVSCYTGPPGTEGVGVCVAGLKLCQQDGSGFGPCVNEVTPTSETCMTAGDDDCDGLVNEEGPGCSCVPGTTQPCYSGPAGTEGVGACAGGAITCAPDGLGFGPCAGEITPIAEDCATPADDDCDGATNDHCAIFGKRFGAGSEQRGLAIAIDGAGNVVIAGRMAGTADFGGGTLTSTGGLDAFVAKFDNAGNHLWSKRFGDAADQEALAVAVDGAGNVLVAGAFSGTINLGGLDHVSLGVEDAFVAKFTAAGAFAWSRSYGDAASQFAHGIAADAQGGVIVTGGFGGTVDFGGGPLPSADLLDGFVLKLDGAGSHLWSKRFGGSGDDEGRAVAVDGAGNALITGYFDETVTFGGMTFMDGGSKDLFVAKLDGAGAHVWSKAYPALLDQIGYAIDADAAGNVAVFGDFDGTVDLGGGAITSAGAVDLFVLKLTPAGAHLWSKGFGDPATQEAHGVAIDASGDVLITGSLAGTVDFGGVPLVTSGASNDVFVVKLSSAAGAHLWSRRFGDTADQDGRAVATDASKNVFVIGEFGGKIDFGTGALTASSDDAFLAKLPP